MAKRGHKANKDKQSQAASVQTNSETENVLKQTDVDKIVKPYGSEQITKYFPTSPKPPSSQTSLENIAGVLTPDTTPTKQNPKTTDTQTTQSSTEAPKQIAAETTDSPEHKKSVPNKVTTGKKSVEENTRGAAGGEGGSGDKEEKSTGKGKKEQGASKGKHAKSGKSRKPRSSKEPSVQTTTLKDYFPVRRSSRRCKTEIEAEQKKEIEEAILTIREDGLKVTDMEMKGRGVVSTKPFRQGDFVVEYYGDLIDTKKAKEREAEYMKDPSIGCYMYYFQFKNKQYCVDATGESGRLGRLLNHSKSGNCCTKLVEVKGQPHLIIVAARDITKGEELLYDYGDRNKESLQAHPWLAL